MRQNAFGNTLPYATHIGQIDRLIGMSEIGAEKAMPLTSYKDSLFAVIGKMMFGDKAIARASTGQQSNQPLYSAAEAIHDLSLQFLVWHRKSIPEPNGFSGKFYIEIDFLM